MEDVTLKTIEVCEGKLLCCIPVDVDENGLYDDGVYESCSFINEGDICPEGTELVTAYCITYDNEWVFNIDEFLEYLWNIENSGVKLLQVRFYPN